MLKCFYNIFRFFADLFFTNKFSDIRNYFFTWSLILTQTFLLLLFLQLFFIVSRLCLGLLNQFSNVKNTNCAWFFVSISATISAYLLTIRNHNAFNEDPELFRQTCLLYINFFGKMEKAERNIKIKHWKSCCV